MGSVLQTRHNMKAFLYISGLVLTVSGAPNLLSGGLTPTVGQPTPPHPIPSSPGIGSNLVGAGGGFVTGGGLIPGGGLVSRGGLVSGTGLVTGGIVPRGRLA